LVVLYDFEEWDEEKGKFVMKDNLENIDEIKNKIKLKLKQRDGSINY
jgi:hypothetical protein